MQTAGAIGGLAASLVRVPTEVELAYLFRYIHHVQKLLYPVSVSLHVLQVVKQRMQTGQFASAPDAVRMIVSKEGFKGLYAVRNTLPPYVFLTIQAFISL